MSHCGYSSDVSLSEDLSWFPYKTLYVTKLTPMVPYMKAQENGFQKRLASCPVSQEWITA